jgi:hypothetical protein
LTATYAWLTANGRRLHLVRQNGATLQLVGHYVSGGIAPFEIVDGRSICEAIADKYGMWDGSVSPNDYVLVPLKYDIGQYTPRAYRPEWSPTEANQIPHPEKRDHFHEGVRGQLGSLLDRLRLIARTVHPEHANLTCFGLEIREALIIASTEVETLLRETLNKNQIRPIRRHYTMENDYFKLAEPLRLKEYSVSFKQYPWLTEFTPFSRWNGQITYQTLPWYQAYNAVKHDRQHSLASASLENLFLAIAGICVTLAAQVGTGWIAGGDDWADPSIEGAVRFSKEPTWPFDEYYIAPKIGEAVWSPKHL